MSTFDILQSRIAQSAKAAAGAARQLSSLDEMAENDQYVQSEGLRLSGKKMISSSSSVVSDNSDSPPIVEDLSGRFVDTFSTAAWKQPVNGGKVKLPTTKMPNNKTAPNNIQLLKSVAVLYDERKDVDARKQFPDKDGRISSVNACQTPQLQHFLQELEYESDSDSCDDEQHTKKPQNDIEIAQPRNVAMHNQLATGLTSDHLVKDVHRFMKMTDQLESEREALVQSQHSWSESSTVTTATTVLNTNGTTAGDDTNKALRAGLSWIRNVASPQIEAFSKQFLKISESGVVSNNANYRRKPMIGPRHIPLSRSNDCQDEEIIVSTSAAFLGEHDAAELERIRMRNSTSWLTTLLQNCIDNPRFAFIAVTLVLALFVYFYSRHRNVDDVL
jgi:hypothetical protein